MHVIISRYEKIAMHLAKKVLVKVKTIFFDQIFTIILSKYSNYSNVFLVKNTVKFSKYINMNNNTIKIKKSKQLLFRFIYS